jgi:tetratricopeptide (TPR) repeat protein
VSKRPKKAISKNSSSKNNAKYIAVLSPELQSVFSQALAYHQQGRLQQAVDGYSKVLSHEPNHPDSLHLVGLVFQSSGDLQQAEEFIGRAIRLNPKVAGYHYNLGVVLQGLGQHSEAVETYRAAIRLKADYAQAYENLGVALQDLDNLKAALPAYQQALAINPKSLVALTNLGTLYFKNGKTVESLVCFEKALTIDSVDPELHMKRAGSLLRMARWHEGWGEYRWRFDAPTFLEWNPVRSLSLAPAELNQIAEKRVLVSCEQGLGDEVMFASCFMDVIAKAKTCVLECDPRLVGLFSRSFPEAIVVAKNCFDVGSLDCYLSAGDLPQYFRASDKDFDGTAYLCVDEKLAQVWGERLAHFSKPMNIGFSWRGGVDARMAAARSINIGDWKPLFQAVDANFINLQYRTTHEELTQLQEVGGGVVHHLDDLDAFNDLEGLAAVISGLDLVISADNVTVHLAGALGVPVWVLLPEGPEWRWPDGQSNSVWYSSARLFHSSVTGSAGWSKVITQVIKDLS